MERFLYKIKKKIIRRLTRTKIAGMPGLPIMPEKPALDKSERVQVKWLASQIPAIKGNERTMRPDKALKSREKGIRKE